MGLAMMLKCWETRSRISSFPGGVASLVSLASLGLTSSLHSPHEMRNEICEAGGTAPSMVYVQRRAVARGVRS